MRDCIKILFICAVIAGIYFLISILTIHQNEANTVVLESCVGKNIKSAEIISSRIIYLNFSDGTKLKITGNRGLTFKEEF